MSVPRRPSRPMTRVPQPGTQKSPTTRTPTHTGKTTRGVARPATGRVETHGSGRAVAPRKSGLPLILAGVGGGLFLLVLVVVFASGAGGKKPGGSKTKKAAAVSVDVSALERDGERKCEEGLVLIQKSEGMMTGRTLSATENARLKSDLERGVNLLRDGMNKLEEANAKSGRTYDVVKYNKAMKAARMKLGELGSVK